MLLGLSKIPVAGMQKNDKHQTSELLFGDPLEVVPLSRQSQEFFLLTRIQDEVHRFAITFHRQLRGKNTFTFKPTKLQFPMIKDICTLGNAFLITEVSTGVLMIVFNTIILGIAGNIGVAAYGIIANLSLVVVAIFTGIAQGVQPLLSSNYGKGNKENLKKLYQYAVITASSLAVIIYIVATIFAEPIVNVFNKDHIDVLSNLAKDGIVLYFIGFIFVGFNIITAILFSSTDQPKYSFVISILRGLIIVIPMVILLSMILGIKGVWLTIPITEALVSIFAIIALKRNMKE